MDLLPSLMEGSVDVGGMSLVVQVVLLVVSILMVAFFSSSEASLISVNKFRVRHLAEQNNKAAQSVMRVAGKHEKFFATILLTENAFIIMASSVGTAVAISLIGAGGLAVVISTVVMTVIIVMFGEITPKSLAAQAAERVSLIVARPVEIIMRLETPVIFLFTLPPRLVMWLIGGREVLQTPSVTDGELRMLVDIGRAEGSVEGEEARLLENVFRFGDRQLREVMTPRTEIIALERGVTLETFLGVYQEHSHTRFPIFDGTVDNVIGTLSVKDVVRAMTAGEIGPEDDVTDVLREAYFVPETKFVGQLFHELRQSGYQVVMVADEFGGLAGLVTLKQMVEEIVGRVSEEGVQESEEYQAIDANTFQADAGMHVDEANAQLALDIPGGEYETLAGFLLTCFGHIPREGEYVHHNGFQLQVVEMRGLRIEQVRLTRVARPEPEASQ